MSIVQDTSARKNGARLNDLFEEYQKQPNSATQNALFVEIQNYAERVVAKFSIMEGVNTRSMEDTVQEASLNIFENIGSFKGRSKFSTWAYTVIRNSFYDELRKNFRRKESSLSEGDYNTSGKTARSPNLSEQEEGGGGTGKVAVMARAYSGAEEDTINLNLDREALERSLSDDDFEILQGYLRGESAQETGNRINKSPKYVSNRRQAIKKQARELRIH